MFQETFYLNKHKIGNFKKPFYIAEIGSNHDQDIEKAKYLINEAAKCKANAVKVQIFKSDDFNFSNKDDENAFKKNEFQIKWLKELDTFAKQNKIIFFASLFNSKYIKFTNNINMLVHKIASSEIDNYDLLKNLSFTKKPILLSTGMTDLETINKTIIYLNYLKIKNIVLMQCASLYPQKICDLNLNVIETFKKYFPNIPIGFSDHSESIYSPAFAISKGACVIEKHITINKEDDGPDHSYALQINEFKEMIKIGNEAFKSGGSFVKDLHHLEKKFGRRKGLYYNKNLKKGDILKISDVSIKSPPIGMQDKDLFIVLNRKLRKNMSRGKPILENDF